MHQTFHFPFFIKANEHIENMAHVSLRQGGEVSSCSSTGNGERKEVDKILGSIHPFAIPYPSNGSTLSPNMSQYTSPSCFHLVLVPLEMTTACCVQTSGRVKVMLSTLTLALPSFNSYSLPHCSFLRVFTRLLPHIPILSGSSSHRLPETHHLHSVRTLWLPRTQSSLNQCKLQASLCSGYSHQQF